MSDIDDLKDQRTDVYNELTQLHRRAEAAQRAFTADEQRTWDECTRKMDLLDREIRDQEGRRRASGNLTPQQRTALLAGNTTLERAGEQRANTISGPNGSVRLLAPEQRISNREYNLPSGVQAKDVSAGRYFRGMITNDWRGAEAEEALHYAKRSEGGAAGTIGGFLLPQIVSDRVVDLARARMTVIQAGAQTLEMASEQVRIAKITGDANAAWRPENTTIAASTVTFGAINLRARTLATYVTVGRELVQDAGNADTIIEATLSKAMAVEWDRTALLGNGVGETPKGLRYQDSVPLTTGTPSATTTYLPLLRQLQAVYNANYPGDAAGLSFIWAPRTNFTYTSLVDGQTQPLRFPPSIDGIPRYITSQVAVNDTTSYGSTENYPQFFGDFSQLILAMRWPLEVEVSAFAGNTFQSNQVAIRCIQRGDIGVAQPTFFSIITGSTA